MKQKRKTQPINLKRYWIGFSLLAILLLIPFRLVGYWMLTNVIYGVISIIIGIVLMRFIWRFGWKRRVVMLMLVCGTLLLIQVCLNADHNTCNTNEIDSFVHHVSCSGMEFDRAGYWICNTSYITLLDTPVGIQISFADNCDWRPC